ncbi:class I SAM-dependent methyltransferase [Enterococcus sp. AZ072]|uniref:class I SAM-dependent methyltransferase n=1 Tax=unclassified Enterococcus TaxID=2608891 RepID=UPI003D2C077D
MKYILWTLLAIVGIIVFFKHLINQSKHPAGLIGKLMMKTWNRTYFPMIKWAVNSIEKTSVLQILDVGIGNGLSSEYLFQQFPNSELHGIDISEEAIRQARKRLDQGQANFQVSGIEDTNFASEQFELICAFQTHFHWEKLTESFDEIARILKPKGHLLLACETSKIKIYLPELVEKESFQQFLVKSNLMIAETSSSGGFVRYVIHKK